MPAMRGRKGRKKNTETLGRMERGKAPLQLALHSPGGKAVTVTFANKRGFNNFVEGSFQRLKDGRLRAYRGRQPVGKARPAKETL